MFSFSGTIKGCYSDRGNFSEECVAFVWPSRAKLRTFLKSLGAQLSVNAFESQIGLKLAKMLKSTKSPFGRF